MNRILLSFAFVLLLSSTASAQDMPLSQILIDGEGWKKGAQEKPPQPFPEELAGTRDSDGRRAVAYAIGDRTLFAGYATGRAVWAFKLDKENKPMAGAAYCPLRVKAGESGIRVTSLTIDKDGRIYAATSLGIQVFDPTGRLCGVITAPPEPVWVLDFQDDSLVAWMLPDTKYIRKLKPTGVK